MARIIVGSYMIRYPLGGMISWVLQYLLGFHQLGHEVYFVEKSGYPNSCYNPVLKFMSNDCLYGIRIVSSLLARFGLQERWCYVDAENHYYGLSQVKIEEIFATADLFLEMGTQEAWLTESDNAQLRVLVDGDPGFTQIHMIHRLELGEKLPIYDFYYTTGRNIGTHKSTIPTVGVKWNHIFHPIILDLFHVNLARNKAPFTTVMNWRSYETATYQGISYGHKDIEFQKFVNLPLLTSAPLELAISGNKVPADYLTDNMWHLRNAHDVTISFDSFASYIYDSMGEFSFCKHAYVATNSGWFSDRSAAYLASGRPVVMQETGFSDHLPCGNGLFAVRTAEEAAIAINEIVTNYDCHSKWAREIANEYLDAKKVLKRFLNELALL